VTQLLQISTNSLGNNKCFLSSVQAFDKDKTDGYATFSDENLTIDFPDQGGLYVVAIMYNDNFEQRDFLTFSIDSTRPNHNDIEISINQTEESLFFESMFKYPELAFFQYKFGSVSNCDENSGYEDYLRIPVFVNIKNMYSGAGFNR
jgi:hypothetical protein